MVSLLPEDRSDSLLENCEADGAVGSGGANDDKLDGVGLSMATTPASSPPFCAGEFGGRNRGACCEPSAGAPACATAWLLLAGGATIMAGGNSTPRGGAAGAFGALEEMASPPPESVKR